MRPNEHHSLLKPSPSNARSNSRWRAELVIPQETFMKGQIAVSALPGLGVTLNE
jgi:hypothetical protein